MFNRAPRVKEVLLILSISQQTRVLFELLRTWLSCGRLPEALVIVVQKDTLGAFATINSSYTLLLS